MRFPGGSGLQVLGSTAAAFLAVRGGGRFLVRLFHIIIIRGLFHTLGFAGGMAVLVVVLVGGYLLWHRRSGRRTRW